MDVSSNGSPIGGVTDLQRAQGARAAWLIANPNTTPALADVISAQYSDGWAQQFEVTQITNGSIVGMTAIPGTLVNNGTLTADAYSDQAPQCGGSYQPRYGHWQVITNDQVTSEGEYLAGFDYYPSCV